MSPILSPAFKYTPSYATDIRKTIAKAKRKLNQLPQPQSNSSAPEAK